MKKAVVIGTRGSALALIQAEEVAEGLRRLYPGRTFQIKAIESLGDRDKTTPVSRFKSKGVFVAELEKALERREIDVAVHSLKDMPSQDPPGFRLGAVPSRLDPRDVLISARGLPFHRLPQGSRLGTGSPRRAIQLKSARKDVELLEIRGNVDTRVRKVREGHYDGVVLAAAGILRMGWEAQVSEYLSIDLCLPAAGQGALAAEVKEDDEETLRLVKSLDHGPTRQAVEAERALLRHMGGGCLAPITAYACYENGAMVLRGMVADPATYQVLRAQVQGKGESPEELAWSLAQRLKAQGADMLLESVKR